MRNAQRGWGYLITAQLLCELRFSLFRFKHLLRQLLVSILVLSSLSLISTPASAAPVPSVGSASFRGDAALFGSNMPAPGLNSFTYEFFFRMDSLPSLASVETTGGAIWLFSTRPNRWNPGGITLFVNPNGSLGLDAKDSADKNTPTISSSAGTVAINNWYHIAITRSGNILTVWVNGTQVSSGHISFPSGATGNYNSTDLALGEYLPGNMTNFRFTNNAALYTSAFTPPNSKLTANGSSQVLIPLESNYTSVSSYTTSPTLSQPSQVSAGVNPTAYFGGTGYQDMTGNLNEGSYLTNNGITFSTLTPFYITIAQSSFGAGAPTNVGIGLAGFDETKSYQVTVKFVNNITNADVTNGTLAATQSGTSLISGYSSYSAAKLGFTGTYAQIAAALSTVTWSPAAASGDISIRIGIASAPGANAYYDANSTHYYKYVSSIATWSDARTAAENTSLFGLQGYLAEITSAAENTFVGTETAAENIWIGATEDATTAANYTGGSYNGSAGQRWIWNGAVQTPLPSGTGALAQGPSAAFSSWSAGEPNNDMKPGQDCAVTNWYGVAGNWNDLNCLEQNGYLIEFGGRAGETTTATTATFTKTVTAIGAALTPSFGSPTSTADGFTVSITNFDSNYSWDTPTVTSGSVAVTSTNPPTRVLTVTGLSPGASATITQTTTKVGYANGSNTVTGAARTGAALNPTFDTPTATSDGFTVRITNYDSNYRWDTRTVTSGSVAISFDNSPTVVLTVTGLAPGGSATITQTTERANYYTGTNTLTGSAIPATTISTANVAITEPVTGAVPVTSLVSNGQYTTAIAWNGSPATFASNSTYTATVTVTPVSGYTLYGVGANFFTVNGAAATTGNLAGAGSFTKTFATTATTISTAAIAGITVPATGDTPVTSTTGVQYNTTISWSTAPARFRSTTVFTATITLTPNAGYTLTGVTANFFTVAGATTVVHSANSGMISAIFPATGGKLSQTITFATPAGMTRVSGNQTLTPSTTATGGYSITLTSNTPSTCSISGSAVVQSALGTCSITASQAGDEIYSAASSVTRSFTITKALHTISMNTPAAMVRSSLDQTLVASSSASLSPLTFSTTTPTRCEIVSVTGVTKVRIKSPFVAGTCSVSASNAGNLIYAAATTSRSFVISKDPQTINFTQPSAMDRASSDQTLTATSSASLSSIVFTSNTPLICSIQTPTILTTKVRTVAPGTCSITASQAGNANYAAGSTTRTFTISKKAQTITLTQPINMKLADADQVITATSTSGLTTTLSSKTPSICTVVNRKIHPVAPGYCYIAANQSGDEQTAPALEVLKTLLIRRS